MTKNIFFMCNSRMVLGDSIIMYSDIMQMINENPDYIIYFCHSSQRSQIVNLCFKNAIQSGKIIPLPINTHEVNKNYPSIIQRIAKIIKVIVMFRRHIEFDKVILQNDGLTTVNILSKFIKSKTKPQIYIPHRSYSSNDKRIAVDFTYIEKKTFNRPTIGFYIGASSFNKSWNPKYFAELLDYIKKNFPTHDVNIYGFGGVNLTLFEKFQEEAKKYKYIQGIDYNSFINQNSLEDDISHARGLSLIVANDSGFMHVGIVLKIPTIAIFGFDRDISYRTSNGTLLYSSHSKMSCSPCKNCGDFCKTKTQFNTKNGKTFEIFDCMGVENRMEEIFELTNKALNGIPAI